RELRVGDGNRLTHALVGPGELSLFVGKLEDAFGVDALQLAGPGPRPTWIELFVRPSIGQKGRQRDGRKDGKDNSHLHHPAPWNSQKERCNHLQIQSVSRAGISRQGRSGERRHSGFPSFDALQLAQTRSLQSLPASITIEPNLRPAFRLSAIQNSES